MCACVCGGGEAGCSANGDTGRARAGCRGRRVPDTARLRTGPVRARAGAEGGPARSQAGRRIRPIMRASARAVRRRAGLIGGGACPRATAPREDGVGAGARAGVGMGVWACAFAHVRASRRVSAGD